jgi:hypothetical protein
MYVFINSHLPNRVMHQLDYLGEARGVKEKDKGVFGSLFWMRDLDKFRTEVPQTLQDKITLTPIELDCRGKIMYALRMTQEGYANHLHILPGEGNGN